MAYDYSKLRGRIVEKYGSQTKFAKKVNVTRQTINGKLSGRIEFTKNDIMSWSELLEIGSDEIGTYFFTLRV